jgi:hypothetical protein
VRAALAALVTALPLATPAHAATPLIGIGEQHPQIFTDEAFAPLGIKDARFVAAYDALDSDSRSSTATCGPRAPRTSASCSASATPATSRRRTRCRP